MAYVVFEEKWSDSFYIKLESEFESELALANLESALIIDSFEQNTPIFITRFTDGLGDLITHNRISPDNEYNLIIGENEFESVNKKFLLAKNKFTTTAPGKTENVLSEIYFVSNHWKELISRKRFRGWERVRYSDVVRQIANECGFENVRIEPTEGIFNVIQPGWTNYQLLKWIKDRAVNTNDVGGYELGIRSDDALIFETVDRLNSRVPVRELYMAGMEEDVNQFFDIKIVQNYSDMINQGASGYRYGYYNFNNRQYVRGSHSLSQSHQRQLSDWSYVTNRHNTTDNFYNGVRDIHTKNIIDSRVLSTSNSIQRIEINIVGDATLKLGDIVNILIAPTEHSKLPVNEFYSGYYMISNISHEILFKDKNYLTQLTLSRQGINGPEVSGFVTTTIGKDISG